MNDALIATDLVRSCRLDIIETLAAHGFTDARLPDATRHPDAGLFELVVTPADSTSLSDLAAAERELEALVGLLPELVSVRSLRGQALAEGAQQL